MAFTTRTTVLLVATMALLIVGTTMASKTGGLRLQRQRLLVEDSCASGSFADNAQCTSGSVCSSGYCINFGTGFNICRPNCATDGSFVPIGDGCSCCSGVEDGNDAGGGKSTCISASS